MEPIPTELCLFHYGAHPYGAVLSSLWNPSLLSYAYFIMEPIPTELYLIHYGTHPYGAVLNFL